jgi:hypothetical protein
MDESLQLTKLWATLEHVKEEIDNVAIPLGSYLGRIILRIIFWQ